jgi:hypothetical protein
VINQYRALRRIKIFVNESLQHIDCAAKVLDSDHSNIELLHGFVKNWTLTTKLTGPAE